MFFRNYLLVNIAKIVLPLDKSNQSSLRFPNTTFSRICITAVGSAEHDLAEKFLSSLILTVVDLHVRTQ